MTVPERRRILDRKREIHLLDGQLGISGSKYCL